MGWSKREVNDNFTYLGDEEGQVRAVAGLLVRCIANHQFDKPKTDYEYVNKAGELCVLSGSASLSRQLGENDCGKFFKAEFQGWDRSKNGKFRKIEVNVWEGEPNEVMQAWPRFSEFYGRQPAASGSATEARRKAEAVRDDFDAMPAGLTSGKAGEAEDDLPF